MISHRRPAPPLLAALLLALLWGVGCENDVDNTPNSLPHTADTNMVEVTDTPDSLPNSADAKVVDVPPECAGCDCIEEGAWYRFESLTLQSLDGNPKHSVIAVLNGLWSNDVKNNELNFYLHFEKVGDTEVTAKIINGARIANGTDVCLLPYTETKLVHPRAGCCLGETGPSAMNVYAGTPIHPKNCAPTLDVPNAIPVRQSTLAAVVQSKEKAAAVPGSDPLGCGRISGKVLSGSLSTASLMKTCTCLAPGQPAEKCEVLDPSFVDTKDPGCGGCNSKFQNLYSLLTKFKPALTFNCKDDAGGPAICLTATYEAVRIPGPPAVCK